jgi:hypothetical protein
VRLDVRDCKFLELPHRAHFIASLAALSSPLERFAAGRGALPVVIPEGCDYLVARAQTMTGEVIVIGSDFQNPRAE